MMRRFLALTGTAAVAAGMILIGAPAAQAQAATGWLATLKPITANKVTGSGTGWITLTGDTAEFTVQISGLVDAVHAAHIHIGGAGTCPTQAKDHNGHPSITVSDGVPDYGSIGTSLTVSGDTSPNSALAVDRFPIGSSYLYKRTFDLDPAVVAALKNGTGVLVVHGIDYNGNGKYDDVLGASELKSSLPAEATDPALCGAFVGAQMPAVPKGSANTGGGSAGAAGHPVELGLGAATVIAAVGLGVLAARRRRSTVAVVPGSIS